MRGRARARSLLENCVCVCMSAWQEFQQGRGEGRGVSKSAHYPRTGSDRAWGGLVWFSLDTNACLAHATC